MRLFWRTSIAAAVVSVLTAQQPEPVPSEPVTSEPVIRGGVELVSVYASVRDNKDRVVADLTQSEFHIFEDGIEQEIREFSRETDVPLTIGLLVDVSTSVQDKIPEERRAAKQFLRQVLRPTDQGFIMGISGKAVLLQDITSSYSKLDGGLDDLDSAAEPARRRYIVNNQFPGGGPFPGGGGPFPGGGSPFPGGGGRRRGGGPVGGRMTGTVLYDALFLAGDEVLQPVSGRKVIILLTDGEDYGSIVSLNEATQALVKANVIVYNIHVNRRLFGAGRGDDVLERISDKTGGRTFEMKGSGDLTKIFSQIDEELRSQYSLAYSPKRGISGGGYRAIEVTVDRKNFKVQARDGYYPEPASIR